MLNSTQLSTYTQALKYSTQIYLMAIFTVKWG